MFNAFYWRTLEGFKYQIRQDIIKTFPVVEVLEYDGNAVTSDILGLRYEVNDNIAKLNDKTFNLGDIDRLGVEGYREIIKVIFMYLYMKDKDIDEDNFWTIGTYDYVALNRIAHYTSVSREYPIIEDRGVFKGKPEGDCRNGEFHYYTDDKGDIVLYSDYLAVDVPFYLLDFDMEIIADIIYNLYKFSVYGMM